MLLQLSSQVPDQDLPLVTGEARSVMAVLNVREHNKITAVLTIDIAAVDDKFSIDIRQQQSQYQLFIQVSDILHNVVKLIIEDASLVAIQNPNGIAVQT